MAAAQHLVFCIAVLLLELGASGFCGNNTDFANGVYDPLGGSGTTLAAAVNKGQPAWIMELTPAYTDVIVKRYIRMTGDKQIKCIRQGQELPLEEYERILESDEGGGGE